MNDKHRKKDAIKKQAKQIESQFGLLGSPWENVIDGLIDTFVGDDSDDEQEESTSVFDTDFSMDDDDSSGFGGGDDGGGGSSDDW